MLRTQIMFCIREAGGPSQGTRAVAKTATGVASRRLLRVRVETQARLDSREANQQKMSGQSRNFYAVGVDTGIHIHENSHPDDRR